jgi:hypothetical protein
MQNNLLYDLIQQLDKSEKRYFKLYAERTNQGDKLYTSLFNSLAEQIKYDENHTLNSLKTQFPKLTIRLLQVHKSHLYDLLLDALRLYHSERTKALTLYKTLESIEILYEKGLVQNARKELNAAFKIVAQTHYTTLLPELHRWDFMLNAPTQSADELGKKNELYSAQMSALTVQKKFQYLYLRAIQLRIAAVNTRSAIDIAAFDEFVQQPLLQNNTDLLSYWSKLRYLQIWAMYYFVKQNFESEILYNYDIVQHLEACPDFLQEQANIYISNFSRWLILLRRKDEALYLENLKVFEQFPSRLNRDKQRAEARVFFLISASEMLRLMQKNDYQALYDQIPALIEKHEKYIKFAEANHYITFWYKCAYVCVALEKYDEALRFLTTVINEYDEEARGDVYAYALILRVLVHFTLENWSLLPYIAQTTYLHLKKRQQFSTAEQLILRFLKKAAEQLSERERNELLTKLYKNLVETLEKTPKERFILNYFDFVTWLKARIERKTFLSVKLAAI